MRLISLSGQPDLPLDGRPRVVGRHRSCDLRVDSGRISRRHCLLAPDGGALLVIDLNSTNGTRVNGRPIGEARLRPGDVLELAHLAYRLDADPPPRPGPPPAPAPPDDDALGTDLLEIPPT